VAVHIQRDGAAATRVSVENGGGTIPPEHLPRLFDRFYRVDPARQRSSDGAGLGLAITQSIVRAHGGTIDVASAYGLTTFCMRMPAPAAQG
jgi:two-component system heavy metal sensor histidine kinase CusS